MTSAATRTHAIGSAAGVSAVDTLVLATVNAPYKRDISAAILQECIAEASFGDWRVHVATFFTDVAPDLILNFASAHGISKPRLAETYQLIKSKTGERNPELEAKLVSLAPSA
jgi:hypothetical protein